MPHALIGYAGSTLRAAEMFHETYPGENLTVLVDYFGKEISDAIAVCGRFTDMASEGRLAFGLDTPGGRFCEGLDPAASYAVLDRNVPEAIRGYRTETELRHLIGPGVSVAAAWHLRGNWMRRALPMRKSSAPAGSILRSAMPSQSARRRSM